MINSTLPAGYAGSTQALSWRLISSALRAMSSAPKKRRIDALGEAIEEAKAELDEREASLERREEQLKKAIEGVDHEKKLMAGRAPSDVLQLNIGGSHCSVSRRTLCQYEPSLLAAKFSGRWDDNVEKDADGRFFIDQPSHLFMPLVDFRYEPYDSPNPTPNQVSSSRLLLTLTLTLTRSTSCAPRPSRRRTRRRRAHLPSAKTQRRRANPTTGRRATSAACSSSMG